jgi:crossover junction endodeoxyribonuclease RusA
MIELTLPWPPSVNQMYRVFGNRAIISERGREYRRNALKDIMMQRVGKMSQHERLSVLIHAMPPDRRRRDIDNLAKAVLDVLVHAGIMLDDSQIDRLGIERGDVVKDGLLMLRIEPFV